LRPSGRIDPSAQQNLFSYFDYDKNGVIEAADFDAAFAAFGVNSLSTQDLQTATKSLLTSWCSASARVNRHCFEKGTKRGKSLFQVLDADGDGKLLLDEYRYLYRVMDLDGDGKVGVGEVGAWMRETEYGLCREVREEVLTERGNIDELFGFLDADDSGSVGSDDVRPAFTVMDTDDNGMVSSQELEVAT